MSEPDWTEEPQDPMDALVQLACMSADDVAIGFQGTNAERTRAIVRRAIEALVANCIITIAPIDSWPGFYTPFPPYETTFPSADVDVHHPPKTAEDTGIKIPEMSAADLSRTLFGAREQISMWTDVVERRTGKTSTHTRALVAKIDAYRAQRGWSPHGFGGEV